MSVGLSFSPLSHTAISTVFLYDETVPFSLSLQVSCHEDKSAYEFSWYAAD